MYQRPQAMILLLRRKFDEVGAKNGRAELMNRMYRYLSERVNHKVRPASAVDRRLTTWPTLRLVHPPATMIRNGVFCTEQ